MKLNRWGFLSIFVVSLLFFPVFSSSALAQDWEEIEEWDVDVVITEDPDFELINWDFSPKTAEVDETVTVSGYIENTGGDAEDVYSDLYVDGSLTDFDRQDIDSGEIKEFTISSTPDDWGLDPGDTAEIEVRAWWDGDVYDTDILGDITVESDPEWTHIEDWQTEIAIGEEIDPEWTHIDDWQTSATLTEPDPEWTEVDEWQTSVEFHEADFVTVDTWKATTDLQQPDFLTVDEWNIMTWIESIDPVEEQVDSYTLLVRFLYIFVLFGSIAYL